MRTNITIFFLILSCSIYGQFPGERTTEDQIGPDGQVYKVKDVVQLGNPVGESSFRNVMIYEHKSALNHINNALDGNIDKTYLVAENEQGEMVIQSPVIQSLQSKFVNYRGKIKYFKIVKSETKEYTFAIIKIPNSLNRIAIPLESAIVSGELRSKDFSYITEPIPTNINIVSQEPQNSDIPLIKSFDSQFNVELLSVIGNKNSQTVKIEFLVSHSLVHQDLTIKVGSSASITGKTEGFDINGNVFNAKIVGVGSRESTYCTGKIPTNVPVKCYAILNRVLPSVEKFLFVSIPIKYKDSDSYESTWGVLEMNNLEIDWNN